MIEIEEYLTPEGASPFGQWFEDLDPQAAAIVSVAIGRLSEGNTSNVKPIGEGAAELRIAVARAIESTSVGKARCWSSSWVVEPSGDSRTTSRRR